MINMKRNLLSDVRWILLVLAMGLISVVGCAPIETNSDGVEPGVDTPVTTIPATEAVTPKVMDERTPTPGTRTDLPTGEVPQSLFDSVLDDVLAVTRGDRADVEVIKAVFSGISLGLDARWRMRLPEYFCRPVNRPALERRSR